MKPQTLLVVAAHTDDEVLGCGGTFAQPAAEGHSVFIAILGDKVWLRDFPLESRPRYLELKC